MGDDIIGNSTNLSAKNKLEAETKAENKKKAENKAKKEKKEKKEIQRMKNNNALDKQLILLDNILLLNNLFHATFQAKTEDDFRKIQIYNLKITGKEKKLTSITFEKKLNFKNVSNYELTPNCSQINKEDSSDFNFINQITKRSNKSYLISQIKNHEISSLTPQLLFYKHDIQNPENKVLMHFETHSNLVDLKLMSNDHKSRGSGIGLKSFNFTNNGKNPAAVTVNLNCSLNLELSSLNDLHKKRNEIHFKNGKSLDYSAYDFIKPFLRKTHFLSVEIGWNYPNNSLTSFFSEELKNALNETKITIKLEHLKHTLAVTKEGRVLLSINYLGSIDKTLSNSSISITKLASVLKMEKDEQINNLKTTKLKNMNRESIKRINIYTKARRSKELSKNSVSYFIRKERKKIIENKKDIKYYLTKNLYLQSLKFYKNKERFFIFIANTKDSIIENIEFQLPNIENAKNTTTKTKRENDKKEKYISKDVITGSNRENEFIFLGLIFKNLFDFDSIKTQYSSNKIQKTILDFHKILSKDDSTFYSDLKELKDTQIILGNVEFYVGTVLHQYEIAQIPISIERYIFFLRQEVMLNSNTDLSIKEFIIKIFDFFIIKPFQKKYAINHLHLSTSITSFEQQNVKNTKVINKYNINKKNLLYVSIQNQHGVLHSDTKFSETDLEKKGIVTFHSHKQEGAIKKISYNEIKQTTGHYQEAFALKEDFDIPPRFYNASITMLGGHYFLPGEMIYIKNIYLFQQNINNQTNKKTAYNTLFRFNGYYFLTQVGISFNGDRGSLETTLSGNWVGDNELITLLSSKKMKKKLTNDENLIIQNIFQKKQTKILAGLEDAKTILLDDSVKNKAGAIANVERLTKELENLKEIMKSINIKSKTTNVERLTKEFENLEEIMKLRNIK